MFEEKEECSNCGNGCDNDLCQKCLDDSCSECGEVDGQCCCDGCGECGFSNDGCCCDDDCDKCSCSLDDCECDDEENSFCVGCCKALENCSCEDMCDECHGFDCCCDEDEFDKENIADTFRPMNAFARARWLKAQRKL